MKSSTKRKIRKVISPFRRIGLDNRNFSIISNNCWGGVIYDKFGLKYNTPTIGLYFFSEDYIKFLKNLKYYLSIEAVPLSLEDSKYKNYFQTKGIKNPIIGKIDDLEIIFVHYNSCIEACAKWNKRRNRVDYSNLIVKYNDQNLFKPEHYEVFKNLEYKKIFFTASRIYKGDDVVFIKEFEQDGYVVDDIKSSSKLINIKKILNNLKK